MDALSSRKLSLCDPGPVELTSEPFHLNTRPPRPSLWSFHAPKQTTPHPKPDTMGLTERLRITSGVQGKSD